MSARLLSLPPELRNMIYEYTVSPPTPTVVDLRFAHPPKSNLFLVNHQIHAEYKGFYQAARCDYWASNHFFLDINTTKTSGLAYLNCLDLSLICHLRLVAQFYLTFFGVRAERRLVDHRGIWHYTYHDLDSGNQLRCKYDVLRKDGQRLRSFAKLEEALESCERGTSMTLCDQLTWVAERTSRAGEMFGLQTMPYLPSAV